MRAPIVCEIQQARHDVWNLQRELALPRSPTSYSERRSRSPAYLAWVRDLWADRKTRLEARRDRIRRQVNAAFPTERNWTRIAVCETGNKPGHPRGVPDWQHSNSSYQGGLGFAISSWDAFKPSGFPAEAYQASPLLQMVVAERIYDRYGLTGWGCRGAA